MTASQNLPQFAASRKSPIGKSGVLTLAGFGIKVRMQRGHLEIEDGVGMERRKIRLPRVGHRLKRLVVIGSDGFVSLAALKWLEAQDAAFVLLERNGKILCVTGPVRPSEAKLRRAQSLAAGNGAGLEIARSLIDEKIKGQERVLREGLRCELAAKVVSGFREKLFSADTFDAIRTVEANAAAAYFREWRFIPVIWPKTDVKKIPDHWRFAGSRQSPLTGGPRLAVTPVHAVLNYCFALLQAETRLCLSALGLDPGLGIGLHTDTANRDSLALDVLEPIRPEIEMWLLNWISREPLRRSDFFETGSGNCRLTSRMCSQLSETAPTWGRLAAPWAEYLAHTLSVGRSRSSRPATRLTQRHKREAKGKIISFAIAAPVPEKVCLGCGKAIAKGSTHCAVCIVEVSRTRMLELGRKGRIASKSAESLARVAATQRRQALAWRRWDPSSKPDWLTEELYNDKIKPALLQSSIAEVAGALKVSTPYAANIRLGRRRPHPRHWGTLGTLVGFKTDNAIPS